MMSMILMPRDLIDEDVRPEPPGGLPARRTARGRRESGPGW
jgi:hypothetical protein